MEKITATNINDLVDQLNANFSKLLASPIFKGLKGDSGIPGSGGGPGLRGSKWTVIDLAELNVQYSTAHTAQSLTESVLQALITDDLSKFIASTTLPNFSVDDLIINVDGKVYRWTGTNVEYANLDLVTPNQAVTYQQVLTLIQNQSVGSGSSLVKEFNISHKKYKDTSAFAASNAGAVFADSILDFDILTSTPGLVNSGIKALGYRESVASSTSGTTQYKIVSVAGHVKELHQIVQNVLVNGSGDTVDVEAQILPDQVPAQVVLQNDFVTGVSIGHRSAATLKEFSQIWQSAANVLNISSKHADSTHDHLIELGVDVSGSKYSSVTGDNIRLKTAGAIKLDSAALAASKLLSLNASKNIVTTYAIGSTPSTSDIPGSAGAVTIPTSQAVKTYVDAQMPVLGYKRFTYELTAGVFGSSINVDYNILINDIVNQSPSILYLDIYIYGIFGTGTKTSFLKYKATITQTAATNTLMDATQTDVFHVGSTLVNSSNITLNGTNNTNMRVRVTVSDVTALKFVIEARSNLIG